MGSLRTPENNKKYEDLIAQGILETGCAICANKVVKEFLFWKIIENDFPYDKIAQVHHMIAPKRHALEAEFTDEEKTEFETIKNSYLYPNYEYIIEPTPKKKSIPAHFHLHIIVAK